MLPVTSHCYRNNNISGKKLLLILCLNPSPSKEGKTLFLGILVILQEKRPAESQKLHFNRLGQTQTDMSNTVF